MIAGHYDVPSAFYQLILDPSMAYSCAYWDGANPETPETPDLTTRAAGQAGAGWPPSRSSSACWSAPPSDRSPSAGTVLFAVGFAFESVGDWQLARFKASAADGQIMDRGLWRYTRHPNYFGDFCMWWGLFAISAGSWRELPALAGPLLMSFILTRGTGARMTDRRMTASRPQYADYVARTSGFIPLPPKRAPKRAPKRSAAAAAPGERA